MVLVFTVLIGVCYLSNNLIWIRIPCIMDPDSCNGREMNPYPCSMFRHLKNYLFIFAVLVCKIREVF